jgi:hypothetical protein
MNGKFLNIPEVDSTYSLQLQSVEDLHEPKIIATDLHFAFEKL